MGYGNFGNRGFRQENRSSPVSVGEELDVIIEASGEKGDGICKKKGFVLFVPNTKEGDKVKIRVTKVLRKVGFAEVIGEADESKIERDERPAEMAAPQPEPVEEIEDTEDFGEEPVEEPAEEPKEEPVEEPAEEPKEEPIEEPAEEPKEEPVEEPAEEPKEEPVEEPAEEPKEEPVEEPAEEPKEEPVEEPAEEEDKKE